MPSIAKGCPGSNVICGDGPNWLVQAACYQFDYGIMYGANSALSGNTAESATNSTTQERSWYLEAQVGIPVNPVVNLSFGATLTWTNDTSTSETISADGGDNSGDAYYFMASPLGTSTQIYNPVALSTHPPMIFTGQQQSTASPLPGALMYPSNCPDGSPANP